MNTPNDNLIVALDVESGAEAHALVKRLGDSISFYKVGLELYAAEGMPFVRDLLSLGKKVFLDLKLYDIGETVKRATARIAETGVTFLTVHAMQGAMTAAVAGRGSSSLKLLGVTVLTSVDEKDILADLGQPLKIADLVALRVRNALAAGMDGIVCSPLEAANVRKITGPRALIVTPGVRSRTADAGDQKRIATPTEAIEAGADYLVIGRQVTRAPDPQSEVEKIIAEITCSCS